MYNFCTLFDSNYFSRGLTLYHSLVQKSDAFHLFIFTFDKQSYLDLKQMALIHATIISLTEFEDENLLGIKNTRTKAEYCWTCTSSTILYCIEKFKLDSCTYLDADLFFYTNPKVIFDEIGDASIGLTSHNYNKKYDQSGTSGIYCVQFVYFKNDTIGIEALNWWREACIDWCYARLEDGKFGDQKYLDDWPTRFKDVHVVQHNGVGVAPWNIQKYSILHTDYRDEFVLESLQNRVIDTMIFFHFHGLKYSVEKNNVLISPTKFDINLDVQNKIYIPYLKQLISIDHQIEIDTLVFTFLKHSLLIRTFLPIHFMLKKNVLLQKIKALFVKSTR